MSPSLVLRVDADPEIGFGHFMRCLALAEAWQEKGGRAVFLSTVQSSDLKKRLRDGKVGLCRLSVTSGGLEDARQTVAFAKREKSEWVVVDGYHFMAGFMKEIRKAGIRAMVLDDFGRSGCRDAELIVDQNWGTVADDYRGSTGRLLLGERYVLLRKEFINQNGHERPVAKTVKHFLISLGGGRDVQALVPVLREAIQKAGGPGSEIRVAGLSNYTPQMAEQIAWADLVFIVAGGTLWETLFMGCPVVSFYRNELQRRVVEGLAERKIVLDAGFLGKIDQEALIQKMGNLINSQEQRARMSREGKKLIDGKGATRVLEALRS